MNCAYLDRDLDAFVDRELTAEADAAVRAHLQTCHECGALVAKRLALAQLVRAVPYYEATPRVRALVTRAVSRATVVRRLSALAAAAVLVISAGGAATMVAARAARADAELAVADHVRALSTDHLFDVRSTDQHTVKPWFQGKLDYSPTVVDLASIGFPLIGGRVDTLNGRAVAALVYQRRLHMINLFVMPADTTWWPRPRTSTVRGFQVRHWTANGMTFWAVSDLNDGELAEFARALGG